MKKLNLCCGDDLSLDDYIHIDIDKPSDELLEGKEFIQLNLNNQLLPFQPDSIDEVVSYSGIGRADINDFAFSEIRRVLKTDGHLKLYTVYLDVIPMIAKQFMNIDCELANRHYNSERVGDYNIDCYNFLPYGGIQRENKLRYKNLCKPTGDSDLDSLADELYNSYGDSSHPEGDIKDLLCEYFESKGFKKIFNACTNIFEKEDRDNWLVVRACQNYMFDLDKFEINIEHLETDDEFGDQNVGNEAITEDICYRGDSIPYVDWIYYMYTNKYPKEEILDLLKKAIKIVQDTLIENRWADVED